MGSQTRRLRMRALNEKLAELGLGTHALGRRNLRAGLAGAEGAEAGMRALTRDTFLIVQPRHICDSVGRFVRRALEALHG